MGKKTFWTGIVLGAVIGGTMSLLNKNARNYAKNTGLTTIENLTFYYKNPSIGIKEVKDSIKSINESVTDSSDNVVNLLTRAETTIDKVTKRIEQ